MCQRLLALSKGLEAQHATALAKREAAAKAEQTRRKELNESFQLLINDMTQKIKVSES